MDKLTTIRDLAEQTGYGKSTVSLALRDDPRLALATRRRIQRAALEAGYRHNPVVAHLMAQLSKSREQTYKATLALINSTSDPNALEGCGALRAWVDSSEKRARELGYRMDRFWLQEPGLTAAALSRVFRARNITGLLIINRHDVIRLPKNFDPLWKSYSSIVVGNRITEPSLNYVCNDQYHTTLNTVKRLVSLGYQKPGLVMCEDLDRNVEYKFSAGYQKGFDLYCKGSAIPVIEPGKKNIALFDRWQKNYKPDVVIAINPFPIQWAKQLRRKINLVSIDRNPFMMKWPGMDQNNEMIGSVAVEQLIGQIHRNEVGLPMVAKCVLIQSTWQGDAKEMREMRHNSEK
jgi:LacI family transcriptional regulator